MATDRTAAKGSELREIANHVAESYPAAAVRLREIADGLARESRKMPCFCGTKDAYRCPAHINPVQLTSGGR